MFIVIYNKQGDQLLKISEAVKIAKKNEEIQLNFDSEVEGYQYVIDNNIYPEVIDKDTLYFKAHQLGIRYVEEWLWIISDYIRVVTFLKYTFRLVLMYAKIIISLWYPKDEK